VFAFGWYLDIGGGVRLLGGGSELRVALPPGLALLVRCVVPDFDANALG